MWEKVNLVYVLDMIYENQLNILTFSHIITNTYLQTFTHSHLLIVECHVNWVSF